jgi:hypothetical protein
MLAGHTAISGRDHHNRRVINTANVVEGFVRDWPLQKFSGRGQSVNHAWGLLSRPRARMLHFRFGLSGTQIPLQT